MLGEKTDLIIVHMIPHDDNGGCMKEWAFWAEEQGSGQCWIWVGVAAAGPLVLTWCCSRCWTSVP